MNMKAIKAALWLQTIADELDRRFGKHPSVSRSKTLEIARELVYKSTESDKDGTWEDLEIRIKNAFKGTDLDY